MSEVSLFNSHKCYTFIVCTNSTETVSIQNEVPPYSKLFPSKYYKPSFISIPFVLSKIWSGQPTRKKNGYGEITQQICRKGLWFLGSILPLIAIYLYTKFKLNTNSSFKVICWTRYRTDRQTDGQSGV